MKSTKRAVKTNCLNSLCDAKYIMERNDMRQTFVEPIRSSFNRTKTPQEINLCLMPFLSLLLKGDLNPTLRGKKPTKASRSLGGRVDQLRAHELPRNAVDRCSGAKGLVDGTCTLHWLEICCVMCCSSIRAMLAGERVKTVGLCSNTKCITPNLH